MGNPFRLIADLFREQVLKSFIVGKLSRMLLFSGSLFLMASLGHLGDLPC